MCENEGKKIYVVREDKVVGVAANVEEFWIWYRFFHEVKGWKVRASMERKGYKEEIKRYEKEFFRWVEKDVRRQIRINKALKKYGLLFLRDYISDIEGEGFVLSLFGTIDDREEATNILKKLYKEGYGITRIRYGEFEAEKEGVKVEYERGVIRITISLLTQNTHYPTRNL